MNKEIEVKKEVYNGYQEYYMTGNEIKEHFKGCYETFGRHHEKISSRQIDFDGKYRKVKDDVRYRVFIKEGYFVKIMDAETDKQKHFFGYTNVKPAWAKD